MEAYLDVDTDTMKIISLMVLRALESDAEALTLASAYRLDDFNYFQRERYVQKFRPNDRGSLLR